MLCQQCQTENRDGRRFCSKCGACLSIVCGKCGFRNNPDEGFCGGCGLALGSSAASKPAEISAPVVTVRSLAERRPVSVMFVDLAGYTELSSKRDPEDVHRLLAHFFEKVDGTIVQFGGTVDKHIGDSVMALFGAPVSHGNDPERAIRAALAIHALMPELSHETATTLQVHIGLALGEVMASGLGSDAHSAYTVTGDAANLAARLMAKAGHGETLVSEHLRQATDQIAAYDPLGSIPLKGLPEPQMVFRLTGLRFDRGAELPLAGRKNELAQVMSLLSATIASGHGAAIVLRGHAGIGKSRLLREIRNVAISQGFAALSALVLDFGIKSGEDAPAAIATGLLGVAADADPPTKLAALSAAIAARDLEEHDLSFLIDLLGLPLHEEHEALYAAMDAAARGRGVSAALQRLLLAFARKRPLLLSIEDVHWANETMLNLIGQLTEAVDNAPVLLVMTTRVEGDPFDAEWRARSAVGLAATIDLRPLRPEEASELATSVMTTLDDFAQQCVKRAEGNPLFLEQLLRNRVTDSAGKLPHSVQGVVLARLDSLGEMDRRILQTASVLGQRIVPTDLAAILGLGSIDYRTLQQRQLLKPEGEGYLFAHALIRDGVYASLTRERRRELHLKAAQHYASTDLVLHAEHLDRAEDSKAPQAYLAAAEAEAAGYRLERANTMVSRGLELAREANDIVALGLAAGRYRLAAGNGMAAREAYQGVSVVASNAQDRCMSLIGLASADRLLTRIDSALENLDQAQSIAATLSSDRLMSEIHYLRGNLLFARGQAEACRAEHEKALLAAQKANLPEWQARAYSGLGDSAYMQNRVMTSIQHFETCVDIAERHQLLRVISTNRSMLADGLVYMLEGQKALAQVDEALALSRRIGDRFSEMFALQCRSFVHFANWQYDACEEPVVTALDMAHDLSARRFEMLLLAGLAEVRLNQGRAEDADELLERAERISKEAGRTFCGPIVCMSRALQARQKELGLEWIRRGTEMLAEAPAAHNQLLFRVRAMEFAYEHDLWALAEGYADELADLTQTEPLPYVDLFVARARTIGSLARNPHDEEAKQSLIRLHADAEKAGIRLPFNIGQIEKHLGLYLAPGQQ